MLKNLAPENLWEKLFKLTSKQGVQSNIRILYYDETKQVPTQVNVESTCPCFISQIPVRRSEPLLKVILKMFMSYKNPIKRIPHVTQNNILIKVKRCNAIRLHTKYFFILFNDPVCHRDFYIWLLTH